jgi:hypothetical protein
MKTYEQQSGVDSAKLENLRQSKGDRGNTLHIYLLCSLPSVQVHGRVVALIPEWLRDVIAMTELQYDLFIMESTLVVPMGSKMSEEGHAAFQCPIRWMPPSAEWSRKAYSVPLGTERIDQHPAVNSYIKQYLQVTMKSPVIF